MHPNDTGVKSLCESKCACVTKGNSLIHVLSQKKFYLLSISLFSLSSLPAVLALSLQAETEEQQRVNMALDAWCIHADTDTTHQHTHIHNGARTQVNTPGLGIISPILLQVV